MAAIPDPPPKPSLNGSAFIVTIVNCVVGAVIALGSLFLYYHIRWIPVHPHGPVEPVKPDPPKPAPDPSPNPDWFGWRPEAPQRKVVASSMQRFAAAAPSLLWEKPANDNRPILLYKAWTTLFKDYPPYPAQQIGDCVSFGHGHANDLLQCVDWVLSHGEHGARPTPNDIQETDTEFIYGESRKIGGMLGGGDGSVGAFAVKAMTTVGSVSRRMLGENGPYSGRRAKQWGRTGPPADVEAMAAKFKLGAAAQVSTWDELVSALHNGNVVTISTARGFNMTRDSQGFCRMQGRWGHCMFIAGVRFDRPGACVVQSWGMNTPSGPTDLDQPSYSFWADRTAIESILSEGDSWALSKSASFGTPSTRSKRVMPKSWRHANPNRDEAKTGTVVRREEQAMRRSA